MPKLNQKEENTRYFQIGDGFRVNLSSEFCKELGLKVGDFVSVIYWPVEMKIEIRPTIVKTKYPSLAHGLGRIMFKGDKEQSKKDE